MGVNQLLKAAFYLLTPLDQQSVAGGMIDVFKTGTQYLAAAVEAVGGLIIGIAVIQALISIISALAQRKDNQAVKEGIRLGLGRWLTLALEFELAADILRTAVAPTWDEIGQLAAIIIIRTVLNYFLQQDIDRAAQRGNPAATEGSTPGMLQETGDKDV